MPPSRSEPPQAPVPGRCLHPVFVYGSLTTGQPLAWVFSAFRGEVARVRGRLWHLPTGYVVLEADPSAGWVGGEVFGPLEPAHTLLLRSVSGADALGLTALVVPAAVRGHTVRTMAWVAEAEHLRRLGATPLRLGDWQRFTGSDAAGRRGGRRGPGRK